MNGSLAMRSTRLRTLLLILVGGGMLLSLYLLTSSQYHLKDVRHLLDACQQQKDSLLAQLQVVYEQKNRVEKYLQQEKLEHKKTQDDNQKNNYLRLQAQKAKAEVDTKLSDLQKEQLSLQERYRELESQTKDLQEQQTQNEEKQAKQQSDYDQNIRAKEEENTLLRGNLSQVLQERDRLENQVVQLNNNLQQLKLDYVHYKRLYTEMNQRLKKLTAERQTGPNPIVPGGGGPGAGAMPNNNNNNKASNNKNAVGDAVAEAGKQRPEEQTHQPPPHLQLDHHHHQQQVHDDFGVDEAGRHAADHQRHPLPPPDTGGGGGASPKISETAGASESKVEGEVAGEGGEAAQPGPPPVSGLRQQLQAPDFGRPSAQQEEGTSQGGVSPSQGSVGGNQPLLPPPPPQDSKQAPPEGQQLEALPPAAAAPAAAAGHQGEHNMPDHHQDPLSQEQKDQDTMVRKPVFEAQQQQHHHEEDQQQQQQQKQAAPGESLLGQDHLRGGGHDPMFLGGVPPWNPFGELGPLVRQQQHHPQQPQQIKSPELKPRPRNNNNNNNRHQEEDENYPEDADDDNAEEQDDTLRDKNLKPFQDNDFEDEGNDHNQAKEEGIVIAPK